MSALAILPIRSGSKSVPNKNIHPLLGKPLFFYALNAVIDSAIFSHVIVTSDSDHYLTLVQDLFPSVLICKRPLSLSLDTTPDIPVLKHALEFAESSCSSKFDSIFMFHATSPLTQSVHIVESMNLFDSRIYDSMVSVVKTDIQPHKLKIIEDGFLSSAVNGLSETTTSRRQDYNQAYIRNGAFYYLPVHLLHQNKLWGDRIFPYIMDPDESIDINNLSDLRFAEFILSSRFDSPNSPNLSV